MDILTTLLVFVVLSAVIKIATDNVANLMKPFYQVKKYKMLIALALTIPGVAALNVGVLETLGVPFEVSHSWFHYFDIVITILFLVGGSKAIHKLDEALKTYKTEKRE